MEDIAVLQEHFVGFFKDPDRLIQALTHKSYRNEHPDYSSGDNERLEFLGDAVLNLVVSEMLLLEHPDLSEGDLSKTRAAVVNESALSGAARRIGLGSFLRLGVGEEKSGGRTKPSLLADALEAVIAAIYLDEGLPAAKQFILTTLADALQAAASGTLQMDYKTRLQELCQGRFEALPLYHLVSESGPGHQKQFEVEVMILGVLHGRGVGKSKKAAEQQAAEIAWLKLDGEEPRSP